MKNIHKRTLFEIEVNALTMGIGGELVEDIKLCTALCRNFREAYLKRNVVDLHEILSMYILELRLLDVKNKTYVEDTGILVKYDPVKKHVRFNIENGPTHIIRVDNLDDFKPFFDVFETNDPYLFFTTCCIYTNDWYKKS